MLLFKLVDEKCGVKDIPQAPCTKSALRVKLMAACSNPDDRGVWFFYRGHEKDAFSCSNYPHVSQVVWNFDFHLSTVVN